MLTNDVPVVKTTVQQEDFAIDLDEDFLQDFDISVIENELNMDQERKDQSPPSSFTMTSDIFEDEFALVDDMYNMEEE
jgi:hypothetical protein